MFERCYRKRRASECPPAIEAGLDARVGNQIRGQARIVERHADEAVDVAEVSGLFAIVLVEEQRIARRTSSHLASVTTPRSASAPRRPTRMGPLKRAKPA
jgi:hypothetical protein